MSQHTISEPSFPTQAELRALAAELDGNALARQLFFDARRFRAIVDLDGVIVAINDFAERERGADVAQLINRPFWEDPIFAGDPLWEGRLRSRFAEALAAPNDTIEYEDRVEPSDAPPLVVRVRLAAIRNAAGAPIGFLIDSQDVAREYRSRALVREQQRLLHVVFERTLQLVAILDPDGKIIDVNDAVTRIGFSRERAVGQTIVELSRAEGAQRMAQWQERIDAMQTATEPRQYFDVTDTGPGGARIATDVSMTPVRNDDGTLDLILLEFRDQTQRYAAEEQLRESEERFRQVVETIPQMVWVVGANGTIEYLSPAWEEFTGVSTEALMASDWQELIHPEEYGAAASIVSSAPVDEREFRMRDRNGEYRWMMSRGRPVYDDDGNLRRWYGATADVTARREADERFRLQSQQIDAAAELAGLGSFVWRAERQQLDTDERYDRILGFKDDDLDHTDRMTAFLQRVHPDDRARVADGFRRSLQAGGPPFNDQYRLLIDGPEGQEERWIGCVASVEFDEQQRPQRMFGAIQDITAARRQDETRVRLQKVEAIGTLVGAVAHDFNNVIGAILSYARVAEAEMQAGEMPAESIAEITRGARRAADVLGRLMTFGREEPPRRIRFDPAEVVQEAAALLRPVLSADTELDLELPEQLPPLDGDPTQVHQVLVNLLTNAAQVLADIPRGHITVRAAVAELDADGADRVGLEPGMYVRISVQDNGPGVPAAVVHRIFDPFFTTKEPGKGTGLGLAAVQSIVRAHHGAVSVLAPPAGGALFSVLLPVVEDAARPDAAPSQLPDPPVAPRESPGASRLIRALFVDDEPALVRLAARAMPYRDIEVIGHTHAPDALDAFRAAPDDYDALVTDLSMPAMSGFALIDEMRAVRPDLPVVLTSGYMGPDDERAAAERRIDAVLPKPCSIDALAAAVQRIVRQ